MVRIFTAYDHPSYATHLLVETLREAAERAAAFDVVLGVQNHHDTASHYLSFLDLLAAVNHPNCKACFDAWTPALQGDDLAVTARLLAPHMVHTTAADYQMRPRFHYNPKQVNFEPATAAVQAVPMGRGFIDYAAFLRTLHEAGYTGGVAYEMCSPLSGGGSEENLDRCARIFLEWLSKLG